MCVCLSMNFPARLVKSHTLNTDVKAAEKQCGVLERERDRERDNIKQL